jgi:Amt family ammonium transporter
MPYLQTSTLTLWNLVAFLVPAGLTLLAIGAAREERAEEVATTALLALAAGVIGFFVSGFALQFGGVAFVFGLPGLQSLTAEWSPLDLAWGPGWGMVGLRGFLLHAEAYTSEVYYLFFSHLAAVTTATLVTLLGICSQVKRVYRLAIGLLVAGLVYPLFGNWVWGGGWLANLGLNLDLGHGFVDAAGAGSIFLLGTLVAVCVFLILRPRRAPPPGPAQLPPVHFPLLMVLGSFLALVGWAGLVLGNPLIQPLVVLPLVAVNLLLAAAGGALVVSLYSWFVTGQPNALAAARGMVAALVAISAGCAFVPAWAALAIGAVAGILLLLSLFIWEHWLKLEDPSAAVATFGVPAVWGILAVAVFADGRWGAGWNSVGSTEYLGITGQGVSGLLLANGYQPAGKGQLYAQLAGLGALLVLALLPWIIFQVALGIRAMGKRVVAVSSQALQERRAAQAAAVAEAIDDQPAPEEVVADAGPGSEPSGDESLKEATLADSSGQEMAEVATSAEPAEPKEAPSAAGVAKSRPRRRRAPRRSKADQEKPED